MLTLKYRRWRRATNILFHAALWVKAHRNFEAYAILTNKLTELNKQERERGEREFNSSG